MKTQNIRVWGKQIYQYLELVKETDTSVALAGERNIYIGSISW